MDHKTDQKTAKAICTAAILMALMTITLGGCGRSDEASAHPAAIGKLLEEGIRPNEMGMVMVLEYHRIAQEEGDYTRSIENFRKDLQTLYDKGFRLVAFSDLMAGKIDLPAGTTPCVFTFDDSYESQFRYIDKNGTAVIDPDCALGMMKEFYEKHPDFGYTALFNCLPTLFEQKEYTEKKLRYLHDNGFEIGNHTVWHSDLSSLSDEEAQEDIASGYKGLKEALPEATINTLCLPMGIKTKNEALMFDGTFEGTDYHHDWALLVGSNPFYPVYHYKNPGRMIPRVQVMDFNRETGRGAEGSAYWLDYFDNHPERRYVSDGNASTVCAPTYMRPRLLEKELPEGTSFVGY